MGGVCPQDAASGAEAEIGVASVDSGVDCVFLASIPGFPDGDHLNIPVVGNKGSDPPCTHLAGEAAPHLVPGALQLSVSHTPRTAASAQGLSLSASTVSPVV